MTVVVDANLAIAMVLPHPYTTLTAQMLALWYELDERLIAPQLLEYEATSALRRAVTIKMIDQQAAFEALRVILGLGIELVAPSPELDEQALSLAQRIGQSKVCDSQYLALAERENAPFWTADRRLAAAVQQAGLPWAHWIGEAVAP